MTETPLIDQLNELGYAGLYLLNACRDLVDQAEAELRILERRARREELDERVAAFFAANPGASANAAWREIGGSRNDVLDAVRRLDAARRQVPGGTTGPEPPVFPRVISDAFYDYEHAVSASYRDSYIVLRELDAGDAA